MQSFLHRVNKSFPGCVLVQTELELKKAEHYQQARKHLAEESQHEAPQFASSISNQTPAISGSQAAAAGHARVIYAQPVILFEPIMYSAHSPTLSSEFNEHHLSIRHANSSTNGHRLGHYSSSFTPGSHHTPSMSPTTTNTLQQQQQQQKTSVQCLRFKYFTTFFVCTTCLVLLSASLATHKWLVAKPIRILRLNNGQTTNFTALMLTASQDEADRQESSFSSNRPLQHPLAARLRSSPSVSAGHSTGHAAANLQYSSPFSNELSAISISSSGQNSKFLGEIYFGLFNGVKVLNYGFGDRVNQLSGELLASFCL